MANNPVGWFEIYVRDMARARKFYEAILDSKLEELKAPDGSDIEMWSFSGTMEAPGASGALVRMEGFPAGGSGTIVYFSSEDCAVEIGRVAASGGRVQQEKMSIGDYGFVALAVDTEGNMFGVHSMK